MLLAGTAAAATVEPLVTARDPHYDNESEGQFVHSFSDCLFLSLPLSFSACVSLNLFLFFSR